EGFDQPVLVKEDRRLVAERRRVRRVAHEVAARVAVSVERDGARLAAAAALSVAADDEAGLFHPLASFGVAEPDAHAARVALDRDRLDAELERARHARLERLPQHRLRLLLLDREHVAMPPEAGAEVDGSERLEPREREPTPHAHPVVDEARPDAELVELFERRWVDADAPRSLARRIAPLEHRRAHAFRRQ